MYGQEETGYCFDDLGTEVDKKYYGNESNVMAEILLDRYDKQSVKGKTHVTSNLNSTMLEERYGYRVRSRIREMLNIVIFDDRAKDRRS
jgi:DNA replication protein DnaC